MNCVILFFFTRFFSVNFLKKFIIFNFIISLILTIVCFIEIGYLNEMSYLYLFNWVNIGIMKINLVLLYDTLTIVMIFIVLFISALVHLYSFSYMRHDPNFFRFIAYLSLFTFFMLVLVTSNNFLQLLIGWEGVGLSSYLLICFWYTRIAANLAAIKAMSVNRIGDIFLLFTIFLIFSFFGSINFGSVFNNVIYLLDFYFDLFFIEIRFIDLVCFFIFLAACGKSAQLLLHIWLPDAMEGWLLWLSLNFTICWNILRAYSPLSLYDLNYNNYIYINFSEKSIRLDNQQETKIYFSNNIDNNLNNTKNIKKNIEVGSSETVREKYNFNKKFIEWFIGFTEGDGSFIINSNGYLEFKITQSSIDCQVLFKIKKNLGFGSVSKQDKKNNIHHYRVRKKEHLKLLIMIFNGNLFLDKTNLKFFNWVNAYNLKYKENIQIISNSLNFNLNNAWLMGFLEAEGCFNITIIKRLKYNQVQVRFFLSQKEEKQCLLLISSFIGGKVFYLKSYNGYNLIINLLSLNKILKYIKLNKFYTKKLNLCADIKYIYLLRIKII